MAANAKTKKKLRFGTMSYLSALERTLKIFERLEEGHDVPKDWVKEQINYVKEAIKKEKGALESDQER